MDEERKSSKNIQKYEMNSNLMINPALFQSLIISVGKSQTANDLLVLGDKRLSSQQFGVQYDTALSKFRVFDLSTNSQSCKCRLYERNRTLLFEGCILSFGGVVKYVVNYKDNGTVLFLTLLEADKDIKEQLDNEIPLGFTDKPINIGRGADSFVRIKSPYLGRIQGHIMFTQEQVGGGYYEQVSQNSPTFVYLKNES